MEIRGKTISFSAYKKKQREQQEKKLIADIETLENNQNIESDTIETKKIELENIRKEKLQGIIIRSRVKWAEEGEKPTRYFCSLESRNYVNKTIPKVEKEDGSLITKQEEILLEAKDYYKKLYKCQSVSNDAEIQRLLQTLTDYPKLTNEEKNNLEGEITDSEILYVLKK